MMTNEFFCSTNGQVAKTRADTKAVRPAIICRHRPAQGASYSLRSASPVSKGFLFSKAGTRNLLAPQNVALPERIAQVSSRFPFKVSA
jgi:hypothetical protein